MIKRRGLLAAALVIAVALVGWLGWRERAWRQAYYAETTGQLIYHVEMAHQQLVRARESQVYQQRLEALSTAHGYLVPAHIEAHALLNRIAPNRKGRPTYMPGHYVPMLLQYARDLSPDLPDSALRRRIDLLDNLLRSLKAGLTDRPVTGGLSTAYEVDTAALKQSLDELFHSMAAGTLPESLLHLEDEPLQPSKTARQQGGELQVQIDWPHTYQLFPHSMPGQLILVRPGAGLEIASDAGSQQRMGEGTVQPFTRLDAGSLHDTIGPTLPPDWTPGSYAVIRVPEGLPQQLTLRPPGGSRPTLLLLRRLGSRENAVAIPLQ